MSGSLLTKLSTCPMLLSAAQWTAVSYMCRQWMPNENDQNSELAVYRQEEVVKVTGRYESLGAGFMSPLGVCSMLRWFWCMWWPASHATQTTVVQQSRPAVLISWSCYSLFVDGGIDPGFENWSLKMATELVCLFMLLVMHCCVSPNCLSYCSCSQLPLLRLLHELEHTVKSGN